MWKKILVLFIFSISAVYTLWAQCSTCKSAAATKDSAGNLIVGEHFNNAILYLLAFPFIVAGFVGILWYSYKKRAKTL